jgi:hypothetical protein
VPEIPDTVRIAGDAVDETSHPATSPHPVLCERMIDSLRSNPISMQRPHAKTSLNSCPQRLLAPQRPAHARSGLLNRACVSGPVDQAQRSFLISDISPQQQRTLVRVYSRGGSPPRRLARRPSLLRPGPRPRRLHPPVRLQSGCLVQSDPAPGGAGTASAKVHRLARRTSVLRRRPHIPRMPGAVPVRHNVVDESGSPRRPQGASTTVANRKNLGRISQSQLHKAALAGGWYTRKSVRRLRDRRVEGPSPLHPTRPP